MKKKLIKKYYRIFYDSIDKTECVYDNHKTNTRNKEGKHFT